MIWVQTLFAQKQSTHGPLSSTYLPGHNDNQTLQHIATLAGHGMEWLGEQPCANLSYMGAFLYYLCAYGACLDSRGNYAKQLVLVAKCWLAINKNSRQFMNHKSLMHVKHRWHLEYHQLKLCLNCYMVGACHGWGPWLFEHCAWLGYQRDGVHHN